MHDNPVHTFFQVPGGNIPDQLIPGGFRWFKVVLYWALLLLETALAISLMPGIAVRLAGIVGVLFILNLLIGLYNNPTEWLWTYVGIIRAHGMFAVARAGRGLGIDNLLAKRLIPGLPYDGTVARAIFVAT